ncbi:unnamed protein product [Durusdinium trenchii]|uniref:SAM-dependent MTase RsmB/NOP-type domain-containing protein n=1 Tax=Durusdinium trenchii TaxID=1381693 RepID=A0ABP0KQ76_9DINO
MLVMSEKTNLFGQSGQHGGYRELFEKKSMDPGLEVCSLSQHPFKHATTSHADGSLPTFLASNYQFLWSMSRSRWLTSKEKWTAMGWPTTQKLATILGRPVVEPRLTKSAHQQIGNAMHVFNAGLIVMSVLGSIELIDIGVPKEIKELGDRHQDLRAALEKVARLPFTAQATEETTACFQEIFEDFGIADLFGDEDELTTVSVLSKLGGANEQAKTEQEAKCKKVSELAIRLSGMRKTAQQKSQKAKERALSKLDEDDEKKKKDKRNKRRRHIWSLTVGRGKKKRIEDDFEGMKSKKEHRPKLTIQQRLDVVNWVLAKKKEIASDSPESKGTSEDEEVDEEEEEVEKGSCEQKVQKQSKRKRGRNLQRMAELQFPHLVGPWISVSRWVQRSKDQQWDNIPQHIREQHKEVPDVWKEAFGNTKKKGKPRFQSVPPEILKSLDEHMAILTSGVSQVTERNEEIMLWQIVDGLSHTAEKMCREWNVKMKEEIQKFEQEKQRLTREVLEGPLGLNLPAGSMDEAEVRKFNSDHAGEAFAILSDSRSHFMTSACFTKMLYSLYGPAFDAQRKRYGLDGKSRGKFLADAWTGFRSNEGGEALERNVWSQLNGVELPSTRPGGWSAHGQPVDQLHNAYRRELMDVGAENLRYHSDMTQRPTFSQLQLGRSGTIKRQVSFDRQLLEDTLTAWRRIPLTHFSAAWSVCGYCSKEEAMDLQTAANMLDPSGMNAAWGAQDLALPVRGVRRLQWQVIKEDNTPAAMPNTLSNGEVAFQSGGEFFISGPNFAASEVRCVALEQTSDLPAAGAAPWRLDNYDFEDDEEQEDTEEEQDDDGEESAQADEELQPPSGWQAEMLPENGHVSSDDEPDEVYELWGGKTKSSKDLTSEQVPGVAKPDEADESQVAEGQVIHRPRGKMTSEEWMLLEKEGWVQKLPQVQDTTLGRHEKSSAWSAKYPHPHGQQQYVSRSFGSIRTPLQALLECMHWLVLLVKYSCGVFLFGRKDMVMNKCLASACHGLVVLEEEAELQSVAGLAEFQLIAVLQQMPGRQLVARATNLQGNTPVEANTENTRRREPFASHAWCRRVPHCRLRVAAGGPLRCEKVLRRWPQLPRQFLAEAVSLGLYALSLRRFLRACARRPLRSWRANPRKVPEARLTRRRGRPTPWCSDGFIEAEEEPGQWLEQYTGEVYVQSLASMLPVEVLKSFMPSLSGAFLDLCSAPGSKASQLALKLHRDAVLVVNEPNVQRAQVLRCNLLKTGVAERCLILQEDGSQLPRASTAGCFEAILLDAPCSAEGNLRRIPEVLSRLQAPNYLQLKEANAQLQKKLLLKAWQLLRPGGFLVYSTCTLNAQENEEVLTVLPEAELMDIPSRLGLHSRERERPRVPRVLRLWPHEWDCEGFFVACLRKGTPPRAPSPTTATGRVRRGGWRVLKPQELQGLREAAEASIGYWPPLTEEEMSSPRVVCNEEGDVFLLPEFLPQAVEEWLPSCTPGLRLGALHGRPTAPAALGVSDELRLHAARGASRSAVALCARLGGGLGARSAEMDLWVKEGEWEKAVNLFARLANDELEPDLIAYNTLMKAYAAGQAGSAARGLLLEMECCRVSPDVVSYCAAMKASAAHEVPGLFAQLGERQLQADLITFSTLISALARRGRGREAEETLAAMRRSMLVPDAVCYTPVLDLYARRGEVAKLQTLLAQIEGNIVSYTVLMKALVKAERLEEARETLAQMSEKQLEPNLVSYTSLLSAFAKKGQTEEATTLVESMRANELQMDVVSYGALLSAFAAARDAQGALDTLQQCRQERIAPNLICYATALRAVKAAGDRKQLEMLLAEMTQSRLQAGIPAEDGGPMVRR